MSGFREIPMLEPVELDCPQCCGRGLEQMMFYEYKGTTPPVHHNRLCQLCDGTGLSGRLSPPLPELELCS